MKALPKVLLTVLFLLLSIQIQAQIKKSIPKSTGDVILNKTSTTGPIKLDKSSNSKSPRTEKFDFSHKSGKLANHVADLISSKSKETVLADGTKLNTTLYFGAVQSASAKGLKETRKPKPESSKEGWTCTNSMVKVTLNDDSFMNASNEQQSANIYPGAVYTFDSFMSGAFNNETAARNPIRITTSAQGVSGDVFEDVETPTPDNIKNAVNKLYRRMPQSRTMTSYQSTIYECNSLADQALKINAGGGGYGFKADFGYNTKNSEEHRYFLIDCTQEMYSLNATMPSVGVFANAADAKKEGMMMMVNVTYGFRVLVSFDTKITSKEQGLNFGANYSGFGANANFDLASLTRASGSETTVKMYIVGGQNSGLLSTNKDDIIRRLNEYFTNTTLQNAKPIKYQFRNMNNEVVVSKSSTDYFPEQHCIPASPDASKITWKIKLTLQSITNESDATEAIHLGLHQSAILNGAANSIINNEKYKGMPNPWLIYWGGYPVPLTPYEEPRTFKGTTMPAKSMSWNMPQSDMENGAELEITSNYIAMVSTRIAGKTDESIRTSSLKIPLKPLITKGHGNETLSVNFNNRVFKFDYVLSAEKVFE